MCKETLAEQLVDSGHDGESVGHIEHVGFAPRPAAIGVQVDRATFIDKAPADGVRFLTVTAGRQTFRMARGGAGLADLVSGG